MQYVHILPYSVRGGNVLLYFVGDHEPDVTIFLPTKSLSSYEWAWLPQYGMKILTQIVKKCYPMINSHCLVSPPNQIVNTHLVIWAYRRGSVTEPHF